MEIKDGEKRIKLHSSKIHQLARRKVAIVGTAGVPCNYGGFETLAENLVKYNSSESTPHSITVYCSSKNYSSESATYLAAQLKYIPLKANGKQSVVYDVVSLLSAVLNRNDVILLLGVSGAIALPLIRLISSARVITNIDGIEWRRQKWQGLAKRFLKFSEKLAIRFSDIVIADNDAIGVYVRETYNIQARVIAYGGDHAVSVSAVAVDQLKLPKKYAFSVCRIEPENNVHLVVDAFAKQDALPLVMVGNWNNSEYGKKIREQYTNCSNLFLLDPIYDLGKLKTLRANMTLYVHGHSAGGTNPSLVEAMHFNRPILAFDCNFNRATTEDKAFYFSDVQDLLCSIGRVKGAAGETLGSDLLAVAKRRYTWDVLAKEYFSLLN